MAKYIGLVSTDMRGKIGGIVTTRAGTGTTLRRHGVGNNKATPAQHTQRQMLGFLSAQWRTLASGYQASWQNLASLTTLTNTLGQQYTPSAQQLFMACMLNYYAYHSEILFEAPSTVPTVPVVTSIDVSLLSGTLTVLPGNSSGTNLAYNKISLTPPLPSVNQSVARGKARYMGTQLQSEPALDCTATWVKNFGPLPAGFNVKCFVFPWDSASGYPGTVASLATYV
jgi:hypothetical protein